MTDSVKIEEFLNTRLSNYASYDNLRKIGSYIDGLKNASRKVLYTIHEKNIKDTEKVSRLASKCSEFSDYLHGDGLWRVIVTLGQDFAGTNNIPLIQKFGAFGCRSNNEPGAPRYIHASGSKMFFSLFNYKDDDILIKQTFEGTDIEPRFYVPTIPIILVNGSEGVSSGFAQKILARNPKSIIKYIQNFLNKKATKKDWLNPFYNGFDGDIIRDPNFPDDPKKWLVNGKVEKVKSNVYRIKEIPFTYDLNSYLKVLDSLEESKTILSYSDMSDGDCKLEFEVKVPKDFKHDDVLKTLKLQKPITENYTCIDENNKIRIFEDSEEIIKSFIDIKLKFIQKRKEFLEKSFQDELDILNSKILFITMVIDKKLKINNVPKEQVIEALSKVKKIVKVQDSYDYLLKMPIYSLTKEKVEDLKNQALSKSSELEELKKMSKEQIWLKDLEEIKL